MDLLIAKTGILYGASTGAAIALIGDANLLAVGALAAFDDSGTLIVPGAAIVGDHVTFAMGTSVGTVFSTPIYRRYFSYNKTVYVAPAKKIMSLGTNVSSGSVYNLNLPASFLKGDTVGVDIIDFNKKIENTVRRVNVSYVCAGGETQAQVIASLVASINADNRVNKFVVAVDIDSVGHDGIQFTAKNVTDNFTVLGTDLMVSADVLEYQNVVYTPIAINRGYTVGLTAGLAPFVGGTGSSTQLTRMELDASAGHGNINSEMYAADLWSMPSSVVAGQSYNSYVAKHVAKPTQPLINETNFDQLLVIAIPATGTGAGADYVDGAGISTDGIGVAIEAILAAISANV